MKPSSTLLALTIAPLLLPASVFAASASAAGEGSKVASNPVDDKTSTASVWQRQAVVKTRHGAEIGVSIAESKATDREVVIVVAQGEATQLAEAAALLHAMGSTVIGVDLPAAGASNALHAVLTWSKQQYGTRVNLFGVGKGADLALYVGSQRTADLWSIMLDGVSSKEVAGSVPKLSGADKAFEGVLTFVDEETSDALASAVGALEAKGGTLVRDVYVGGPRLSADLTSAVKAAYKVRIETFLFDTRKPELPSDCLVCGPQSSGAPRRVTRLRA